MNAIPVGSLNSFVQSIYFKELEYEYHLSLTFSIFFTRYYMIIIDYIIVSFISYLLTGRGGGNLRRGFQFL